MGTKYSFIGRLQIVCDNSDRQQSILYTLLFILRNAKMLYLDIYELLIVNYVALTEKRYVFKLKFNIKTWLKIFKIQYHEKQVHINEPNEQRMAKIDQ